MRFPNKYLRNLKPYRLASHAVWSVPPKQRDSILKLDWNEASVPPSPYVKQRILEVMDDPDFFHLYPTTSNDVLLEKLAAYVGVDKENVQYFSSSDALHEYICKVYISVGDPVIILGPSYDNFRLTCQANGAEVFYSNYNDDFTFDAVRFEQDITEKEPAVVYICNPNNPTGNQHSVEYIEHLLNEFSDTLFLIDEAYCEFSGISCKDLVTRYDNILISRTMSKAFAIANFRVGYLIASKENVEFVNRIRNPKNISTMAQIAAEAVLDDVEYMRAYVREVLSGKRYFIEGLAKYDPICVIPGEGNFILLKLPSYEEKMQLLNHLVKYNIFVRDTMQSASVTQCFRITCGLQSQMKRVLDAIDAFYAV